MYQTNADNAGPLAQAEIRMLERLRLSAVYQPVFSVSQRKVIGVEGLIRATDPLDGHSIRPDEMFLMAGRHQASVRVDRRCRDEVISTYAASESLRSARLFVNVDASVLDLVVGSDYLMRQVSEAGLDPTRVVIEINEAQIQQAEPLQRFIQRYRGAGFLIALDDIGSGYANFERLAQVRPDILKLDRSLVSGISGDSYKQEVFRCLVKMANHVGALVVAEGVETEQDSRCAVALGAHMLQGFFFSRPYPQQDLNLNELHNKMDQFARAYIETRKMELASERAEKRRVDEWLESLTEVLRRTSPDAFEIILDEYSQSVFRDDLECIYVLNWQGIQITPTVFGNTRANPRKKLLFIPQGPGEDSSLKPYYFEPVHSRLTKYISEPYISNATGNVCVTQSQIFRNADGQRYLLCVDFARMCLV